MSTTTTIKRLFQLIILRCLLPINSFLITPPSFESAHVSPQGRAAFFATRLAASMESVVTPKTNIPHNFGPTSDRDGVLFTAERPGNSNDKDAKVPKGMVEAWIDFMKQKGVGHVLVLLDDNEFGPYEGYDLLETYQAGGLQYHRIPMGESGAYHNTIKILEEIKSKKEKAVTHCTGGTGRAGRVAAAWLAKNYNLTPQEATQEAIDSALQTGVNRLGNVEKLSKWMK